MTVQILGGGCPKCHALEQNARDALARTGLSAEIELITDMNRIPEMGVLVTPALAVDGTVKASGKVLSADEIVPMLGAKG